MSIVIRVTGNARVGEYSIIGKVAFWKHFNRINKVKYNFEMVYYDLKIPNHDFKNCNL